MLSFMITSFIVNITFASLCYWLNFWRKWPIHCAVAAFVIGFLLVFFEKHGFDGYDQIERVFFALIFGVLDVQAYLVVEQTVFRKL